MNGVTIALAKGRLAKKAIEILNEVDIHFSDLTTDSRKLIFDDNDHKVKVILVKADDVATYVEKGAADIGIVGKDTLMEAKADVYEVLDLGFGKCKFSVAAQSTDLPSAKQKLTVATKYPNVAKDFYSKKGIYVETIKLHGSVELAPLIGLSDVIVDIVESGRTLKENGLKVVEDIADISARLIVNKASFKTKVESTHELIEKIRTTL
ncbi:ATP phosphoribosyltransferase [Salirhabdus salicampi]|uniref:ATP phosphoribosyltransferase n=1 Tax=Salirhabdus salicampi TaxID=476102 RepID=UPI0020C4951B|nr:ATP phosphoribosyltransferase [Salirhabdus salicampi]